MLTPSGPPRLSFQLRALPSPQRQRKHVAASVSCFGLLSGSVSGHGGSHGDGDVCPGRFTEREASGGSESLSRAVSSY